MSSEIERIPGSLPELPPGTKVYILLLRDCANESPLSVEKGYSRQEVYNYLAGKAQERKKSFYKWLEESGNKDKLHIIVDNTSGEEVDVYMFSFMFAHSTQDLTKVLQDAPDLDYVTEDIQFQVKPFNT